MALITKSADVLQVIIFPFLSKLNRKLFAAMFTREATPRHTLLDCRIKTNGCEFDNVLPVSEEFDRF